MESVPTYVVLNGGGIQGMHFIGTLAAMEDCHWIQRLRGCAGSSVGSIIALALVCGIDSAMTQDIARRHVETADVRLHIMGLFNRFGMNDGAAIQALVEDVLISAKFPTNITFRALFYSTGKILHVTGTDLTRRRSALFNHLETPDMPVLLAILISTRIPIIFEPIRFEGRLYCDGSVTRDFPMDIFPPEQTVGVFLRSRERQQDIDSLPGYLASLFMTVKQHYFDAGLQLNPGRTIIITHQNDLEIHDFTCSDQEMRHMIATGYAATMRWWMLRQSRLPPALRLNQNDRYRGLGGQPHEEQVEADHEEEVHCDQEK